MNIKVKLNHKSAKLPKRSNYNDAGADLYAVSKKIKGDRIIYDTGVAMAIPDGYVGLVFPRSSVSKKNLIMANCVGVVDSGYRGSIKAVFKRLDGNVDDYNLGERIAQIVIMPIELPTFELGELDNTTRGTKGFGSTGK